MLNSLGRGFARPQVVNTTPQPSLDLNFMTLTSIPSSFSLTRASTGLYIDSDKTYKQAAIDAPRFQHDLITGARLGLLLEPLTIAKNLYARPSAGTLSAQLVSVPSQISIVTDTANPCANLSNGGQVWEIDNTANGSALTIEWQGTTGITVTHNMMLHAFVMTGSGGSFSLSGTGATTIPSGATSWTYFKKEAVTPPATTSVFRLVVNAGCRMRVVGVNLQQSREGTSSRYATQVTSLVDSAGAQTTRSGDQLDSVDFSWFNAAAGTGIMTCYDSNLAAVNATHRRFFQFDRSNSVTDRMALLLRNVAPNTQILLDNDSVSLCASQIAFGPASAVFKVGMAFDAASLQYAGGGTILVTDTSVTPLPDQLSHVSIGYDKTTGANNLNMCVQRFRWYSHKMTQAELEQATL